MASEGYHEEGLSDATKDMHRAIVSLMEELEAVDWYQQRIDATSDGQLARILAHNRDEEKEHAAMALEWLRRHDPKLDELYPKNFAAWVAAESNGEETRVDVLDPSGSTAAPIDARGITEKFRGINPQLPVDEIAGTALDIEKHSVKELLALLAAR